MNINEMAYIAKITRKMAETMDDNSRYLDSKGFLFFIDGMMKEMGYSYDAEANTYRRDE